VLVFEPVRVAEPARDPRSPQRETNSRVRSARSAAISRSVPSIDSASPDGAGGLMKRLVDARRAVGMRGLRPRSASAAAQPVGVMQLLDEPTAGLLG